MRFCIMSAVHEMLLPLCKPLDDPEMRRGPAAVCNVAAVSHRESKWPPSAAAPRPQQPTWCRSSCSCAAALSALAQAECSGQRWGWALVLPAAFLTQAGLPHAAQNPRSSQTAAQAGLQMRSAHSLSLRRLHHVINDELGKAVTRQTVCCSGRYAQASALPEAAVLTPGSLPAGR